MNASDARSATQDKTSLHGELAAEVQRLRGLIKERRYHEALSAAQALLHSAPGERDLIYLVAGNQRCLNQLHDALATLQKLEQTHPRFSGLHQERGLCYMALGETTAAIEALSQAVELNPAMLQSWQALERLHRLSGDDFKAASAAAEALRLQQLPGAVLRAGALFSDGYLDAAADLLYAFRSHNRVHVEASRLLGRIEHQRGRLETAQSLLCTAIEQAPRYLAAQVDLIRVLIDAQRFGPARERLNALLAQDPGNAEAARLSAPVYLGLGQYDQAVTRYRQLLGGVPADSTQAAQLQMDLAHALQAQGRRDEAIDALHAALAAKEDFGDAYWSLANLKVYRFSDAEIHRMEAIEAASRTATLDRVHLCFALGKAYEDRAEYERSWRYYERGNALKRAHVRTPVPLNETDVQQQIDTFTADFFAARAGAGVAQADPIFVLGLPRSGSTLVEQILASHSQVEATRELAEMQGLVLELALTLPDHESAYPAALPALTRDEFLRLGQCYLDRTQVYRQDKPRFVDKMPNNFRYLALIHLILPNARIIDVRRDPMACCFSNFKQLYASGQEFSYSMGDLARYYGNYIRLMQHWDEVLSGRVLRVDYEDLVNHLEENVRRVLAHCGLNFEPACLAFHQTERNIATPSSEQVRQPIFREALEHWRHYEPWLGPLKQALGDPAQAT